MGTWLSNISLKYKFWAVNAVAFVTTLLLVLYAVQLEQQSRSNAAQANARAQAVAESSSTSRPVSPSITVSVAPPCSVPRAPCGPVPAWSLWPRVPSIWLPAWRACRR